MLPVGIGAVIGGVGNRLMGKKIVTNARGVRQPAAAVAGRAARAARTGCSTARGAGAADAAPHGRPECRPTATKRLAFMRRQRRCRRRVSQNGADDVASSRSDRRSTE